MFGYEKGAFTGAFQPKAGKFEIANRGTVLLDEIGDMDLKLQAKLLQVLQDGEFYRLGGKEPVKVDVRVVAATHRDLETAVSEGTFREDLYHRLNVVSIRVPPLRERREDIVPLAEHFLAKHCLPDSVAPEIPLPLREALIAYRCMAATGPQSMRESISRKGKRDGSRRRAFMKWSGNFPLL